MGHTSTGRTVIEEKELINRILGGDKDLYGELVDRHKTGLFQLCLAVLRDPHEAEDAAQVVFIKAYRSLGTFRGGSTFRTWITRIGLNQCKDILRQKSRRKFLSLDFLLEGDHTVPAVLVSNPGMDLPEGPAVTPEMFKTLSEGERKILRLVQEREDLSYEEMGKELGLSLDGVKGRLKRARAKIQLLLKEGLSKGG